MSEDVQDEKEILKELHISKSLYQKSFQLVENDLIDSGSYLKTVNNFFSKSREYRAVVWALMNHMAVSYESSQKERNLNKYQNDINAFKNIITIQMSKDTDNVRYKLLQTEKIDNEMEIIDALAITLSEYLRGYKEKNIKLPPQLEEFEFNIKDTERWNINRPEHFSMKKCIICGAHVKRKGPNICYDCFQNDSWKNYTVSDEDINTMRKTWKSLFKEKKAKRRKK